MTPAPDTGVAPCSTGGGASASEAVAIPALPRIPSPGRWLRYVPPGLAILACLLPGRSAAQEPPDSVPPPDTVSAADSLAPARDSLAPPPDSLLAADSLADSLVVVLFPELPDPSHSGWATGVWEWGREALLGNPALSLAQLLDQIPGTIALRGGDFGTPNIVTAFGGGGGRVRLYIDGFELTPLRAGAPDLAQVGLAGFQHVRVRRSTDGLRVELTSLEIDDPRPYSLVEVGTGDLQTNLLRATFSHPATLGGSLAFALDRLDTQGTGRTEPGATTGGWLRYTRPLGSRLSLRGELRRISASRPGSLYTPEHQGRSDWNVRARADLAPGLTAELFTGRSSATARVDEGADSTAAPFSRGQTGVRLSAERAFGDRFGLWTTGRWALMSGDAWPEQTLEVAAGLNSFLGGVEGGWSRENWLGGNLSVNSLRAWTAPVFGFSVFGERRDGGTGVPFRLADPRDTIPEIPRLAGPPVSFTTERRSTRTGARFAWGGLSLGVAQIEMEQDQLAPFGFPMDSAGVVQEGGKRSGREASARLASLLRWPLRIPHRIRCGDDDAPDWRYLPRESWNGQLGYHNTFLPTDNFEIWTEVGVAGREPMVVPFMALEDAGDGLPGEAIPEGEEGEDIGPGFLTVPYHQSWYFRLQIRILTVQVFILTENFTAERELQDFPERFLPGGRSIYGIKWTLWN